MRMTMTLPAPVAQRLALGLMALLLAVATFPRQPGGSRLAVSVGVLVVGGVVCLALARPGTSRVIRTAAALAALPLIAALFHATPEGLRHGTLVVLPLLWLTVRGRPRELLAGSALAALTLVGPLVAGVSSTDSVVQWRQAALWGILAPLVALGAQPAIASARRRTRELESLTNRLASIERSFRTAFAEAPVSQFMCMPDGTLLRVNDALCALTGREREDLLGAEVADLVLAEDYERIDRVLRKTWRRGAGVAPPDRQLEVGLAAHAGEARQVAVNVSLVRDDHGRPLYLLGQLVDVTARRAAAQRRELVARTHSTLQAVTRQVAAGTDPRWHVCEAARALSAGAFAALVEPAPDGQLKSTARAGAAARAAKGTWSPSSPAGIAFRTGEPVLATGLAQHDGVDERRLAHAGIASALFEPIVQDGGPVGVLAVGWTPPAGRVDEDASEAIRLLAAESAALFTHADELRELVERANRDALTGLPNRRMWEEQLPREIARAQAEDRPLCVALMDLDHFKAYNDEHGHPAGDRLLVDAAAAWRARLRRSDMLVRYGGEEFAALLPGCETDQALELLERLRAATPKACTCSVGLVRWDGRESREALVERADRALYMAKRNGRDRTHVSLSRRAGPVARPDGAAPSELAGRHAC